MWTHSAVLFYIFDTTSPYFLSEVCKIHHIIGIVRTANPKLIHKPVKSTFFFRKALTFTTGNRTEPISIYTSSRLAFESLTKSSYGKSIQ